MKVKHFKNLLLFLALFLFVHISITQASVASVLSAGRQGAKAANTGLKTVKFINNLTDLRVALDLEDMLKAVDRFDYIIHTPNNNITDTFSGRFFLPEYNPDTKVYKFKTNYEYHNILDNNIRSKDFDRSNLSIYQNLHDWPQKKTNINQRYFNNPELQLPESPGPNYTPIFYKRLYYEYILFGSGHHHYYIKPDNIDYSFYALIISKQFKILNIIDKKYEFYQYNPKELNLFFDIDSIDINTKKYQFHANHWNGIAINTIPITIQNETLYLIAVMDYNTKATLHYRLTNHLNVPIYIALIKKSLEYRNQCNLLIIYSNYDFAYHLFLALSANIKNSKFDILIQDEISIKNREISQEVISYLSKNRSIFDSNEWIEEIMNELQNDKKQYSYPCKKEDKSNISKNNLMPSTFSNDLEIIGKIIIFAVFFMLIFILAIINKRKK